jgi:predicted ribosomally synthesized peptide with SipW-like signal peptide
MKKQLAIAVGALLTLGTAVSASLNDYAQPTNSVTTGDSATIQLDSRQSAQIVALWNTHASSSGSVPLARPL